MYVLEQLLRASATFPEEKIVTVETWDRRPTRDELIALSVTPLSADRLLTVGTDSRNLPFLFLRKIP